MATGNAAKSSHTSITLAKLRQNVESAGLKTPIELAEQTTRCQCDYCNAAATAVSTPLLSAPPPPKGPIFTKVYVGFYKGRLAR